MNMDLSDSNRFDIFEIYRRYCAITTGAYACGKEGYNLDDDSQKANLSREELAKLLKLVESTLDTWFSIFDEIYKLMLRLDLMVGYSEFSRFYDFVFFICRENSQKNITVSRAVMAWRLVLAGRFRLLNEWCSFVEKNQRYNISEDTWRQVLAFSRCVHENLEGYDPEGAWPVLIDDFVEHMYRTRGPNDVSILHCTCGDPDGQPFEEPLPGLRNLPGLKRKCEEQETISSDVVMNVKKRRHICFAGKFMTPATNEDGMEVAKYKSGQLELSPCAVEGCLSRGFAGLLSTTNSCLQFDRDRTFPIYRRIE